MTAVAYRLVYDASQMGVEWTRLTLESLALLIVAALLFFAWRRAFLSKRQWIAGQWVVFAALALWWWGAASQERQRREAAATLAGRASVIEGAVEDFRAGEFHVRPESFSVGGMQFSYWAYGRGRGFKQTAELGGPVRAGLRVRIHYVGHDILRLEIAE